LSSVKQNYDLSRKKIREAKKLAQSQEVDEITGLNLQQYLMK